MGKEASGGQNFLAPEDEGGPRGSLSPERGRGKGEGVNQV